MTLAKPVTLSLMMASIGYWVLCIVGTLMFRSRRPRERAEGTPAATILKPVKGLDPDLADNCRAACRQDYPAYQVIFGVADPQDPAIPLLQSVLDDSPGGRHRLVIGPEVYGPNRKVSLLQQMLPFAAHEILVISDSDVRIGPEYLRHIAPPFLDETIGLVTCLYRGTSAVGLVARLWLLLPGDLFAFTAWALSFAGDRIRWRGTLYRIIDGGRLVELGKEAERSTSSR